MITKTDRWNVAGIIGAVIMVITVGITAGITVNLSATDDITSTITVVGVMRSAKRCDSTGTI